MYNDNLVCIGVKRGFTINRKKLLLVDAALKNFLEFCRVFFR